MGCDIHYIVQKRVNNSWEFVDKSVDTLEDRNYMLFGALAGVRDYWGIQLFDDKGLPEDLGNRKYKWHSELDFYKSLYEKQHALALVIPGQKPNADYYEERNRLKEYITKEEYEAYGSYSPDYTRGELRYSYTKSSTKDGYEYYCYNAGKVGGIFKYVDYKDLYDSFEEFLKHYADEYDEELNDYGYYQVNFDCEDFHTPSWLTLKELTSANTAKIDMNAAKVSKEFFTAFERAGGELPSGFIVEESAVADLRSAMQEAIEPTVTIRWGENDNYNSVRALIEELKKVAEEESVAEEDLRIVFAFDN